MNAFQQARIKLTLWYLLILTTLLAAASAAAINAESRAFDRIESALADRTERPRLTRLLEERLNDFEQNFKRRLFILDGVLIVLGAFGSYFLSGRTLDPIQQMIVEQEEFAADASHELRTPLTTIGTEIEAVRRTQKNISPEFKRLFESIQQEVFRMRGIVDGLLTLIRGKTSDTQLQGFDVSHLVKESLEQMRHLAHKKKITVTFSKSSKITVLANKEQIKQVILILLDNALNYTPENGKIEVRIISTNSNVNVSVSDTGIGIPESDLPNVFNRFYRVHRPNVSFEKGAGLGLAIAKKIIHKHQGKIWVTSHVGKGTTFYFSLPVTS